MPVRRSVKMCFTINVVLIAVRFLFTTMTTIAAVAAAVVVVVVVVIIIIIIVYLLVDYDFML